MKHILRTTLSLLLLSASCAFAHPGDSDPGSGHPTDPPYYEVVLKGFLSDHEGLRFQVFSGGCTTKADFELLVQESYPPVLTLMRKNFDSCEAHMPHGTTLFYSNAELGISDNMFQIGNIIEPGDGIVSIPELQK